MKYIQTIQHAETQQEEKNDTDKPSTSKRRRISDAESPRILFPADTCIICDKKQKRLRGCNRYEKLVKCLTSDAETSVKQAATQAQEIEVIGRVQEDLRARETYYHESCRQSRLVKVKRRTQAAPKEDSNTAKKKAAYEDAFSHVCGYIEDQIIGAFQVERMTMLRERFCSYMQEKHPDYYNPNYKTQKLKRRIAIQFGTRRKSWTSDCKSELVYSANLPKGQAVESAFVAAASEERRTEDTSIT